MADASEVLHNLKENSYSPVYFLQGDEPFLIDQISDFIEKNALEESAKGFNQIILYGKDVKMADVLNNAKRFPMMSDRQVVIVKEAQSILDFNKDLAQKMLSDYISDPLPSTILVFCYKYKKLDGRKATSKEISKKAILVSTKKLYDNQLPLWITSP